MGRPPPWKAGAWNRSKFARPPPWTSSLNIASVNYTHAVVEYCVAASFVLHGSGTGDHFVPRGDCGLRSRRSIDRLGCLWPESTQCAPCDFGANRHAARIGDFSARTFWGMAGLRGDGNGLRPNRPRYKGIFNDHANLTKRHFFYPPVAVHLQLPPISR